MFQLTNVRITQAASGGHLIRPRTGDLLELHIGSDDEMSDVLDPAVYPVSTILCDIFRDEITFLDEGGKTFLVMDGKEGTDAIIKNLVILADTRDVKPSTDNHPIYGHHKSRKAEQLPDDNDGDFL